MSQKSCRVAEGARVMNEADTCRKYVVPKLTESGWDDEPHLIAEQRYFTDGHIVVAGNKAKRRPQKRADYLLRFTRDLTIAVVEAKASYKSPGDGLPAILTTSQLLTTGVDAPTCKNVVLARVIGSMTEFKQIIGRGTRVRDDYGKLFFSILDYTGSARLNHRAQFSCTVWSLAF